MTDTTKDKGWNFTGWALFCFGVAAVLFFLGWLNFLLAFAVALVIAPLHARALGIKFRYSDLWP